VGNKKAAQFMKMYIYLSIMILTLAVIPITSYAHIVPGEDGDHSHDHAEIVEPYIADTEQPIYSQLAECAAIYASAGDKPPNVEGFMDAAYKKELAENAPKFMDKAVSIARKKNHETPEQDTGETYKNVYKIWAERWVFEEDEAHYELMAYNQQWLTYCQKLGLTFNVLPQFPNDPE